MNSLFFDIRRWSSAVAKVLHSTKYPTAVVRITCPILLFSFMKVMESRFIQTCQIAGSSQKSAKSQKLDMNFMSDDGTY